MNADQEIWIMKRNRIYKGLPVSFNTYYADSRYCSKILKKDAEKDDILRTIEQAMGKKIHKVSQTLRSVASDLDISSALKIPFGAPVFFNETIYNSVSGKILFFSQNYFRGDMFVFRTSSLL